MGAHNVYKKCGLALFICLILVLPPTKTVFESTMTSHMLVQMPLLVCLGWYCGWVVNKSSLKYRRALYPYRWAMLIASTGILSIWMIPRLLDLAYASVVVDLVKGFTLSIGVGFLFYMAWINIGPVAKGIYLIEAIASFWRLGWLYLASDVRFCVQYGLSDQIALGYSMLVLGGVFALWLMLRALGLPLNLKIYTKVQNEY